VKIGILFNCQRVGIKLSLQALRPNDEIASFMARAQQGEARERALAQLRACDAIVAVPVIGRSPFGEALQAEGARHRMVIVPPVVFGGFHPDTIVIDTVNGQLEGPTGPLHSRIALAAFLAGLDVADTADLYNRMIFKRLGYFDQFPVQHTLFHERFQRHGIDLLESVPRWKNLGCFMHNQTHPKANALMGLAEAICGVLGLTPEPNPVPPADTLEKLASHPVHADLAQAFGVPPETHFRANAQRGADRMLSLETYLAESFATYAVTPRALLLTADGVGQAAEAIGMPLPDAMPSQKQALARARARSEEVEGVD
jgi:hypothetical protein